MKRIRLMVMWGFMRNGIDPSVQNKKPGLGLGLVLVIAAVAGLLFIACNTEPEIEHRIDLFLNDSLSKDAGKYDSLAITILDTSGGVIRANAFNGPYLAKPNGNVLKGIVLGNFQPAAYVIDIRAFQSGEEKVRVQIKVAGDVVSPIVRVYTENPNPNTNGKTDTVPTGVDIAETEMNFAFGDAPRALTAKLKPDSARGQILWSSNKTTVATVSGEGLVSPHDTGTAMVFASVVGHAHLKDSVMVRVVIPITLQALAIQRTVPVLFTGGPTHKIGITYEPSNQTPIVTWKSSDTTTVRVNAEGTVTGLKAGQALITVTASGANPLSDTLTVTVRKDAPILVVSPDQQVDVGQAVTFRLNASQQFGTLTLSWDFTGDGLPEGSANSLSLIDSATATHTYATAGNYEAVFTAKDGEGNETQVKRRVVVGKQGPLIVITSPKQDTTVNTVQFMVRYTSDGAPLSEVFNLKSGLNTLWVKATNALGTDSVAVRVTLDTIPPTPPTFDVARTTTSPTNVKKPTWTWSPGTGGIGVFRWSLNTTPAISREDTSKTYTPTVDLDDGSYTLTVSERDSVGNWSAQVSREIVIQTAGPLPPRVTASAALTRIAPTFSWTGTGRTGARFRVRLYKAGTVAPLDSLETATLTYAPAAALFATSDDVVFTLRVREQDALGNWGGDGQAEVRVDNVAPARPVFTVQPPALVNAADTRTSLQWTWGRVGVADSFVVTLNDIAQPKQAGTTYSLTTFPDGNYALSVVAVDPAGNTSTAAAANAVVVDKRIPATPTPTVSETPTRDNTPTWSWSGAAGMQYAYRIARGANPIGQETAITTTSYTPTAALSDGVWYFQVRAQNAAGNWSAWSASSICTIKATAPLKPAITRNATVTNAPVWSWSPNGGGDGSYRYRWSGATVFLANDVASTSFAPTALADGAHTLCVSERDVVGYGADSCLVINVDKTPPAITGYSVSNGFITNQPSITIGYSKDGAAGTYRCSLVDQSSTRCDTTVYDAANNPTTVSRTIWRRSNVVFVRAGATGRGDGSSWVDAYPSAGDVLRPDRNFSTQTQLWIARGTYTPGAGYNGFYFRKNLSVFGGFAGNESDTTARDLANNVTVLETTAFPSQLLTTAYLDTVENLYLTDLQLKPIHEGIGVTDVKKAYFNRIRIVGGSFYAGFWVTNSKVHFSNSTIQNNTVANGGIKISQSSYVHLSNTKYTENSVGGRIEINNSTLCADKSTVMTRAGATVDEPVISISEGEFLYDQTVTFNPSALLPEWNYREVISCLPI